MQMNARGAGQRVPAWRRSGGGQHGYRGGALFRAVSSIEDPGRNRPESVRQGRLIGDGQDRPDQDEKRSLVGGRTGTAGTTTGLYGAGGFGKTTLAQMVCADRRVRRLSGRRVFLVTVGRDVRGAAAMVNDVIKLVAGEDVTFADPQLAGRRLGSLLGRGDHGDRRDPENAAPHNWAKATPA